MSRIRLLPWLGLVVLAVLVPATSSAGYNVGQHIHTEITNHPVDWHPIPKKPYTFHVVVKLHNETGATSFIRLDDGIAGSPARRALVLGPCADCSTSFDWTIDFSTWSTGRHELRWHVDIPRNNDGNRQFTTSRSQLCVVSCSPSYRSQHDYNGGGSWYLDDYATVTLRSPERNVKPGGSFTFEADQDATRSCAFLNPDFHAGSSGTRLGCFAGGDKHTLVIPSTAHVGDRLVLYADQPNGNAGLFRVLVGDGSDRSIAAYEYQSWWAKGGVVLP